MQIQCLTQSKTTYRINCFRNAHDLLTKGESTLNIPFPSIIDELHRELKPRHKVYTKRVQKGELHVSLAAKRTTLLQQAISLLCGR